MNSFPGGPAFISPRRIPQGKIFFARATTLLKLGHPSWYLPSVCLWDQQPPASSAPHQP